MAFVVTAATAIGTTFGLTGAAATAGGAVIGLTGIGTGAQVYGQLQAGKAQEAEFKRAAEERRIQAESDELARQEALGRALAANAVALGMSNIKSEGVPASISLGTAKTSSLAGGMSNLTARLEQAQFERQGKSARVASKYGAATSLISGATDIARVVG